METVRHHKKEFLIEAPNTSRPLLMYQRSSRAHNKHWLLQQDIVQSEEEYLAFVKQLNTSTSTYMVESSH